MLCMQKWELFQINDGRMKMLTIQITKIYSSLICSNWAARLFLLRFFFLFDRQYFAFYFNKQPSSSSSSSTSSKMFNKTCKWNRFSCSNKCDSLNFSFICLRLLCCVLLLVACFFFCLSLSLLCHFIRTYHRAHDQTTIAFVLVSVPVYNALWSYVHMVVARRACNTFKETKV